MKFKKNLFPTCISIMVVTNLSSANAVSVDPEELIAKYAELIHFSVSPQMPSDKFVSILPIGLEVDNDTKYYPLADSCLKPNVFTPDLSSINKVSDVYSLALDNMARIKLPSQPSEEDVELARQLYQEKGGIYEEYNSKFIQLKSRRDSATSDAEKVLLNDELHSHINKWRAVGYKDDIEEALHTIKSNPKTFRSHHRTMLDSARKASTVNSPKVVLSVSRKNWGHRGGWVTVKFTDSYKSVTETTTIKRRRGSAGLKVGFFRIGGSGSSTKIEEIIETDIKNIKIEFDLKLVNIERPWFNSTVFFEPGTWGWRMLEVKTSSPPYISRGLVDGQFVESIVKQEYGKSRVDCQLIPSAFLLSKRRKVEATVSNDTFNKIQKEREKGGSLGFFSFDTSKNGSYKFDQTVNEDSSVTFSYTTLDWEDTPSNSVNVNDVVIIGTISDVVPLGPSPSDDHVYEDGVWRNKNE